MNAELVINSTSSGVDIALLHDRALIELHRETLNQQYGVGDVYLGRVRKLIPHLNACFVDVGYDKDAFLHYQDLGPQFASLNAFSRKVIGGEQNSGDFGINHLLNDNCHTDLKMLDVLGIAI